MELNSGDAAPTFSLTDENGKLVSTDAMRGKKYVVYFYPKDDTPGCTVEACQFNDNLTAFETLGIPVLGVSRDDAASHRKFQEKFSLKFPLLSDPDRKAHDAYGAWGEKSLYGKWITGGHSLNDQGLFKREIVRINTDGSVDENWPTKANEGVQNILP